MRQVAIILVNYNMPERTDALCEFIQRNVKDTRYDLIVVDNGSDLKPPSKHTALTLKENVQTTNGWLMGLAYADALEKAQGRDYFAYWLLITSSNFMKELDLDPLTPLVRWLETHPDAVIVHPALSTESTTHWEHMKTEGVGGFRQVHMVDNIASLYRAGWFNGQGRFDPTLIYAHGVDLEICWKARSQGKTIWICEESLITKVTDIGYHLRRMRMTAEERVHRARVNMDNVLGKRYGNDYWNKLLNDFPIIQASR